MISPPEPDLTPELLIERARALRPLLRGQQDANDGRGIYSVEIHKRLLEEGFYRILQPRALGGYEFELETFAHCIMEISRGHPAAAWGWALAAHSYVVAMHWPQEVQAELFGANGDVRAACVLGPTGKLVPEENGYRLSGQWGFCSGIPISNYFIGNAALERDGAVVSTALFVVPRDKVEILPDWNGELAMGMQASGSNSVRISELFVPARQVVTEPIGRLMMTPPESGTIGSRLYGNPLYVLPFQGWFHTQFAAILSGAARAAIDEYELVMRSKPMTFDRTQMRMHDPNNQRVMGEAMDLADAAEMLTLSVARYQSELCRRWARCGTPITWRDSISVSGIAGRACAMASTAVELLFKSTGSGIARSGNRLQRYFRDVQMYWAHLQSGAIWPTLRAAEHLGAKLPPGPAPGQVIA